MIPFMMRGGESMGDFQIFLDENLGNINLPKAGTEVSYEEYDIYSEIVTQIKKIRESEKVTQKELARRCGLTQANISNIEKGITKPTIDSLRKIADALDMRLRVQFEIREELQ